MIQFKRVGFKSKLGSDSVFFCQREREREGGGCTETGRNEVQGEKVTGERVVAREEERKRGREREGERERRSADLSTLLTLLKRLQRRTRFKNSKKGKRERERERGERPHNASVTLPETGRIHQTL